MRMRNYVPLFILPLLSACGSNGGAHSDSEGMVTTDQAVVASRGDDGDRDQDEGQVYPHVHWKISGRQGEQGFIATQDAAGYLNSTILQPLRQAVQLNSKNGALLLELARWEREH